MMGVVGQTADQPEGGRTGRSSRWRGLDAWAPLLLAAAVLLQYHRVLGFFFWSDDYHYLGPPAAGRFLAAPFAYLAEPMSQHFAPLAKLWYALVSVCFGLNPVPYHALILVLLVVDAALLHRLMRRYGLGDFPSLAGSLYFALAVSHSMLAMWNAMYNYLLLGLLFLVAALFWETYLESGGRRALAGTVLSAALAAWVHGIALSIPLFLASRVLLREGSGPLKARRGPVVLAAAMLALQVVQVGVPHLFSSIGLGPAKMNLSPLHYASASSAALASMIGQFIGSGKWFPSRPLAYPVGAGFLLLFSLWLVHRRNWRLFLLGVLLAAVTLSPPIVLTGAEAWVLGIKFRWMFIPNLGFALVLAAVLDGFLGFPFPGWAKRLAFPALVVFLVLSFVNNAFNVLFYLNGFAKQDAYLRQVASSWRSDAPLVLGRIPCPVIRVLDTPLDESVADGTGTLILWLVDHSRIHGFFFWGNGEAMRRFSFTPWDQRAGFVKDKCAFLGLSGRLIKLKEEPIGGGN